MGMSVAMRRFWKGGWLVSWCRHGLGRGRGRVSSFGALAERRGLIVVRSYGKAVCWRMHSNSTMCRSLEDRLASKSMICFAHSYSSNPDAICSEQTETTTAKRTTQYQNCMA